MNKKNILLRLLLSIAWVLSTNASAQYYKLVTSETELIDGHQYLIVNTEFSKAISTVEKAANNLNATPVIINGDIIQNAEDAAIFTLKAYTSSYSFHREDVGYLCATDNSRNELTYKKSSDDCCKATITFGSDNTTAIQFIKPTSNPNLLRYNSEDDLFNCYKSGQEPVSLFHYMSGDLDKEFQNLIFSTTSAEVYFGDNFEEPTLSGAMTNVTYSSSNSSVAEVNPTTGEIYILNAGTTIITATAEADDTYNTANASYTLTVKLTEDIFDFTKPEDFGFESPITSRDTPVDKTITKGVVSITATHSPSTDTRFFNGKNDGIYLGIYINGGGLTFSVPDGYIIESIVFTPLSAADIKGFKEVKNNIWTGSTQSVTFNATETAVKLTSAIVSYKRQQTVSISAVGYSTFSSEHAVIVPSGMQAGVVTLDGDIAQVDYIYQTGDIIPAHEGVLLKANPGSYDFTIANSASTNPAVENYLQPANTNEVITAPTGVLFYILANDPANGLGFYFQSGSNNGTQVLGIKGKAYLAVEGARQVRGFRLEDRNTSHISEINQPTNAETIYSIDGRIVKKEHITKGIYMINGKKYIIK